MASITWRQHRTMLDWTSDVVRCYTCGQTWPSGTEGLSDLLAAEACPAGPIKAVIEPPTKEK